MKKIKETFKTFLKRIKNFKFRKKEKNVSSLIIDENTHYDEIKVNFKKSRLPKFIIANKKSGLIASLVLVLPLLGVGAGVTLGIMNAKDDKVKKVIEVTTNKDNVVIYLLDKDNLAVPVTLKVDAKASQGEKFLDSFNYLKTSNGLGVSELRGYIPNNAKVKSFNLEGSNLTIDLSKEFLDYEEKYDYNMMQAMTFTYLEYDNIDSLTYLVEGEHLGRLKNSRVTLPNQVSSEIGINHQFTPLDEVVNSEDVIVYYQKTISNKSYLVPISQTVSKGENKVASVYNAINKSLSPITGLTKIKDYSLIDLSIKPYIENEKVFVSVLDEAKIDEVTIKRDVYELVKLTLEKCDIDEEVSLLIEGETCLVDGYYEENSASVSTFTYNTIAI